MLSNAFALARPSVVEAASFPNILGTISVDAVQSVAINTFTNRLYALSGWQNSTAGMEVVMIDGSNNQIMSSLHIDDPTYNSLFFLRLNSVRNLIYLPFANLQRTYIIDGNTNQIVKTAPEGVFSDMAVDSAAGRIYTVNNQCLFPNGHTEIKSWDADMNLIARAVISGCSGRVAFNHKLNVIYVADGTGLFQVIDPVSLSIITTIQVLWGASQMSVDEETGRIYITAPNDLQVIDGNTNTIVSHATRPATDFYQNAVNTNTGNLYIAGFADAGVNTIFRYSEKTGIIEAGNVNAGISTVTINPTTNAVYLTGGPGIIVLKDEPVTGPPSSRAELTLAVVSEDALSIVNNSGDSEYYPNPFDIATTVKNIGAATATDVIVELQLPVGLAPIITSTPRIVTVGSLAPSASRTIVWQVQASPQVTQVTLPYSITVVGTNADTNVANKIISIPALPLKDSDCDSLPDTWEESGYNGVSLKGLGASKNHKDIFVYVDWLKDGNTVYRPSNLDEVIKAFAIAPIPSSCPNPDKKPGINLHILWGVPINMTPDMQMFGKDNGTAQDMWDEFVPIRNTYFPSKYRPFAHYALFARELARPAGYSDEPSGLSDPTVRTRDGATSFIVAPNPSTRLNLRVPPYSLNHGLQGMFMHELGHNLGLGEGGVSVDALGTAIDVDNIPNKPNHLSVMNYLFMASGIRANGGAGEVLKVGPLDYSRFSSMDFPSLNEANLNEKQGLNANKRNSALKKFGSWYYCNGSKKPINDLFGKVNWNCNSKGNEVSVSTDITRSLNSALEVLTTVNEWYYLVFSGGGVIGSPH